jgi:CHAD domain-containing protein
MNEITSNTLLTPEDRISLQAYIDSNPLEAPYQRRVRILLLADEGATQEAIAVKAGVPIVQVRQMLRAYHRQGMGVFPPFLFSPAPYSPDTPITEAGRQLMAALLLRVMSYIEDLETDTSVTAVHESRKTIRRLRTALRLFAPYYEAGLLNGYRRRFKKFMGRLSRSRDAAVFLIKLDDYLAQAAETGSLSPDETESLAGLRAYWEDKLAAADAKERDYLDKDKFQIFLAEFEHFATTEGEGFRLTTDRIKPSKTRHVAPLLIGEKLAAVRAYDDAIEDAAPETLHAIRIAFKELRYTLDFFEQVMGPTAGPANETVKQILTHLGDLNDARIHLEMLAKSNAEGLAPAVAHYRSVKMTELARLTAEFPALWSSFDRPEWRQDLYTAVAIL